MSIDTERLNVQASVSDTRVRIVLNGENGNIIAGGNGADGDLILQDNRSHGRVHIDPDLGNVYIYNDHDRIEEKEKIIRLMGQTGNIESGGAGKDGDLVLRDRHGNDLIHLGAEEQNIIIKNADGTIVIELGREGNIYAGGGGKDGDLVLRTGETPPRDRIHLNADKANVWLGGNGADGDIVIFPQGATNRGERSNLDDATIHLDGDAGDIKLQGADCAEEFDVAEIESIDPGTVLVIGNENKLYPCKEPYDKKVAGVVSGGNDTNPGIILGKKRANNNRLPIGLNGKVYCKVEAQSAPIEIGDLLTTSAIAGHAMKADNPLSAFGAVIGKALRPLKEGKGLI